MKTPHPLVVYKQFVLDPDLKCIHHFRLGDHTPVTCTLVVLVSVTLVSAHVHLVVSNVHSLIRVSRVIRTHSDSDHSIA